jgi:hypothetical protein
VDEDRGEEGLIGQVRGTVEQITQMSLAKGMQTMQTVVEQVQVPVRQIQEWVSGGSLQAVTEDLRELAGRLRQEIERQVLALDRTRKGLEQRITGQIEALGKAQRRSVERVEVGEGASTAGRARSTSTAKRSTAKRSTAKRATAKRATVKRATVKRATARRSSATASTAAPPAPKKSTARKSTARKSTSSS